VTNPNALALSSAIQVVDLGDPPVGGPFSPHPSWCPRPEDEEEGEICDIGRGLRAVAINEQGDVAIQGYPRDELPIPFLLDRGTFELLPPLANGGQRVITAVNAAGEAAGYGVVGFELRAVRFSQGVAVVLPTGSDNVVGSRAFGINERGDIVGSRLFLIGADELDGFLPRATLWRRTGEVVDLGALDEGRGSEAYSINNAGVAVGISGSNALSAQATEFRRAVRPVMFKNGRVIDLGGSPACAGAAYAVNERGKAAGRLCNRATLWDGGQAVPLDTPLGAMSSAGFGISSSGDVVGRIEFPQNLEDPYRLYAVTSPVLSEPFIISLKHDQSHVVPALWRGSELTVLPTLTGTYRQQGAAYAINNSGQIVGVNLVDDQMRAVRWTLGDSPK